MAADDSDDCAWLQDRIKRTEELIVIYEDAIAALAGGAQSYSLSTGQTTQMVTKANLSGLRSSLDALESRREALRARLNGGAVHIVPGW